jgi:hypothetical protein
MGIAVVAVSLCAPSAFAITEHYELGTGSSVSVNNTDPSVTFNTAINAGVSGRSFSLDDGQSTTFSFFYIWTTQNIVEEPLNTTPGTPMPITATLDFTDPARGVSVEGLVFGGYYVTFQGGFGGVTWNGPVLVDIPGERSFEVSLNDATFGNGLLGGAVNGATIKATVTQISSNQRSVPDGASTAGLFGLAFLGLGALRQKLSV